MVKTNLLKKLIDLLCGALVLGRREGKRQLSLGTQQEKRSATRRAETDDLLGHGLERCWKKRRYPSFQTGKKVCKQYTGGRRGRGRRGGLEKDEKCERAGAAQSLLFHFSKKGEGQLDQKSDELEYRYL